ncbi:hypothetical protein C8R47DRAFT_1157761 [Mycena vitilis]|nr:hypothetical protein C8R47DRAFT_1157761 [Mycena vitilis]
MQKFPITPNSLRSVTLAEFDAGQTLPSANLWKDIFMACARHSSSLRSIKASIHNTTGAITMHPCTPGMPFLEPLLECRLLHDILMVGFPPISLHEHEIATIACTWPSLYSLCLPHSPSNHTPSAAALYSFANHCPNLRSLTISVHTRGALAQQSVVQRLEPNQPSLEKLTILSQPVGSPAAEVLDLLLAIFPTLKSVDSLLDRSWDTVTDLLRAQRINTHATGDSPW